MLRARLFAKPLFLAATCLYAGTALTQSSEDQTVLSDSLEIGSYRNLIDRIEGEYGA